MKVTPTVTSNTALEDEITFVVGKDGAITMNIANLPNESFFFDYKVELVGKDRGANSTKSIATVTNNVVTITAIPTAINFTAATVADTSLEGGKTATLDFGTIANYADFTATGVAVTATANVSGEGITATAAIDSNGKVTANVEGLVKGEYTVTVTLSASGCTSVTTGAAKVTVTSDKPVPVPTEKAIVVAMGTAYEGMKGVLQLAKAEQRVTFDVVGLEEGVSVTSWKSSKPAYVAIDEHGIATLKKAGKAKITATMSDNSKLSIDVNVNKGSFADPANIKLLTKPNKKWVDVTAGGHHRSAQEERSQERAQPLDQLRRRQDRHPGHRIQRRHHRQPRRRQSCAHQGEEALHQRRQDHHADHHRQWRQVQRRDQGGFHRQGRVPGGSDRPDRGDRGARGRVTSPTMGAAPGTHTAKPSPSLYSKSPGSRRGFC